MLQRLRITGYNVPWSENDGRRPVFSTVSKFEEFLGAPIYEREYTETEFNPRQETLVVFETASTAPNANLVNDNALTRLQNMNYIKARVYLTADDDRYYDDYFYFVTENTPAPIYDGEQAGAKIISLVDKIKIDVWGTYVLQRGVRIPFKRGTIIEQSTPLNEDYCFGANFEKNAPAAAIPFGGSPADFSGRHLILSAPSVSPFLGGADEFGAEDVGVPLTKENCFYFVGVFGSEYSGVLVLARPVDIYELSSQGYTTLGTLLHVSKLAPREITTEGGLFIEKKDGLINGDTFNVNLLRAYIVPRKALQGFASQSFGYVIKETSDLGEYPYPTGFLGLDVNECVEFDKSVPFLSRHIDPTLPQGISKYVDIGTPTSRIEITPPSGANYAPVRFTCQASTAGYSLIIQAGGRQIDVGGDFEIPVPDNAEAEAFARNKWSVALQGVSQVGGVVAAVTSKNPVAIVGAAVSTGQYLANIGEAQSVPATIQGQGNGFLTYASARKTTTTNMTRGAVYCRYALASNTEAEAAERWGYKWRAAWTTSSADFLTTEETIEETVSRRFIKTAACEIVPERIMPREHRDEFNKLFDEGLTIYYNPANKFTFGK